jgi:Ca-activated chloride channel family protein
MMIFAAPWVLLLLIFIMPMVMIRKTSGGKFRFSNIALVRDLRGGRRFNPRSLLVGLRVIAFTLFVLALARPQWGTTHTEVSAEGVDIMLTIDTSGSMRAHDFQKNGRSTDRLSIVKDVVASFIEQRSGDRMGLVVFGAQPFLQCPLTLDHGVLMEFLEKINIGMAGDSTALGSALAMSVQRMKDLKAKSKVIVLLTDGRSNAGRIDPEKAAEIAQTFGVKVYTIGSATKGLVPMPINTPWGTKFQYVREDLDEDTLKMIADKTGGKFYRATDTVGLQNIYDEINKLEKTEAKVKRRTDYNDVFTLLLLPALLLLLVEIILANTWLRKIP